MRAAGGLRLGAGGPCAVAEVGPGGRRSDCGWRLRVRGDRARPGRLLGLVRPAHRLRQRNLARHPGGGQRSGGSAPACARSIHGSRRIPGEGVRAHDVARVAIRDALRGRGAQRAGAGAARHGRGGGGDGACRGRCACPACPCANRPCAHCPCAHYPCAHCPGPRAGSLAARAAPPERECACTATGTCRTRAVGRGSTGRVARGVGPAAGGVAPAAGRTAACAERGACRCANCTNCAFCPSCSPDPAAPRAASLGTCPPDLAYPGAGGAALLGAIGFGLAGAAAAARHGASGAATSACLWLRELAAPPAHGLAGCPRAGHARRQFVGLRAEPRARLRRDGPGGGHRQAA